MKKGTPLYENIYIGGFIYALGVISGQKGHEETEAFSLIQQTPDDKIIADLFARWKGANFIIEFKRKRNDIKSELKKRLKRKLLDIIWDKNNPNFEKNLSFLNKCHFICFADDIDFRTTLNFLPYAVVVKKVVAFTFTKILSLLLRDLVASNILSVKGHDERFAALRALDRQNVSGFEG